MQLICPVCADTLIPSADGRQLSCAQGHSYDRAKQGYWNLLLVQSKRSKDPGDNAEMVQARSRFLDAGHYRPLLNRLTELLQRYQPQSAEIVDLGCGEGYYTQGLSEQRRQQGFTDHILGLDISKHAIRAAARRSSDINWVVASSAQIPVQAQTIDLALIIFSRVLGQPLERILKPGGHLIIAYPGSSHLLSLRERIYDEVRLSEFSPQKHLSEAFQLEETASAPYEIELSGQQQIADLLAMTPHGQRINQDKRQSILSCEQLKTTIDIELAVFRYMP